MTFILSLLVLLLVFVSDTNAQSIIVDTQYGPVEGVVKVVNTFRKIPYAKPPVGELRWTNPQAPDSWTSPLLVDSDLPHCLQGDGLPNQSTEDCLYLNVFTPLDASKNNPNKYKVMVWIHGGSFISGYGGGAGFNGTNMVQTTDVIVVSINYRLGKKLQKPENTN